MIAPANEIVTVGDHAARYRQLGFSTIPIRLGGSKAPAISEWKSFSKQLPTESQINSWFSRNDSGVAIIHGAVSGGTEVVDIDNGDLLDPYVEALETICPGLFVRLCVIQTPRPGYHLVYRCEEVSGSQKLAFRPSTESELAANPKADSKCLIETKGEGGYTVAPGSPGSCHSTGREYVHLEGPGLDQLPTITSSERQSLFAAARLLDRMPVEETPLPISRQDQPRHNGESPGDAYGKAVDWASILEPHGYVHVHNSGDRALWRRPGKTD